MIDGQMEATHAECLMIKVPIVSTQLGKLAGDPALEGS